MRGDWCISLNAKQNHHTEVKSDKKQDKPTIFEWMEKLDVQHRKIRMFVVAQLIEALRYKPEGRGFYSRWCN
jgi:hypothetical protein